MKFLFKNTLIVLFLISLILSCKKEDASNVKTPIDLGGAIWSKTAIDTFIRDSLTIPYNVAVNYKWLPGQLDFPSNISPASEDKVIPVLLALLNVAYKPYNIQTGSKDFLRKYLPKTLILAGSGEYLANGAKFLGQAEGGTSMLLYEVNYYSRLKADSNAFKQMMHTMHHEFGHILHQNVMYPVAYKSISTGYTGTWFNVTNTAARQQGFITNYAMSAPDEDFVEMISTMLAGGQNVDGTYGEYESLLTQAGTTTSAGYIAIKAKEAIVVDYFQKVWKIDFYALRATYRSLFVNYLQ